MCEPTTAMLALTAASTAMAAYGQYQGQRAANDATKFNAEVGNIQAQQAQARGALEEDRLRLQSGQFRGTQRARLAGTGVDIASGSALDLQEDTAALTALDAATIRRNTANEVWAYRAQAGLDRSATGSPTLSAAPTVLGGATQFAERWYRYKGTGTTPTTTTTPTATGNPRQLVGALY